MNRLLPACLAFAFALASVSTARAAAPSPAADVRRDATVAAIERVMPAVVNIATETVLSPRARSPLEQMIEDFYNPYYRRQPSRSFSLGSGVIIDEDGYIVTNNHVVQRASRISVKLQDGREFECDRVGTAPRSDVALLKIRSKPGEKFAFVKFAEDGDLLLGETVIALGNPFGLGGSVSRGILSSKNRRPVVANEVLDVADWLQTDAAINPGNSGGPLINLRGDLIGISVAVHREGQGIGFAIPIKLVSEALSGSFTPETLRSLWFGARAKAGVSPATLHEVEESGPAHKAGLRAGDVILAVDGKSVGDFIEFNRALVAAGEARDCTIRYRRGTATREGSVRLVPEKSHFNEGLIQRRLGASVQELTPELAGHLGLRAAEGLLVAGVEKDSPADRAGLQRGHVITTINDEVPADMVGAARQLHTLPKGGKARLGVIGRVQRGPFVEIRQSAAEAVLR